MFIFSDLQNNSIKDGHYRDEDTTSKYSLNVEYRDMQGVLRGVSSNCLSTQCNLKLAMSIED
jgi:hypothetical protein